MSWKRRRRKEEGMAGNVEGRKDEINKTDGEVRVKTERKTE